MKLQSSLCFSAVERVSEIPKCLNIFENYNDEKCVCNIWHTVNFKLTQQKTAEQFYEPIICLLRIFKIIPIKCLNIIILRAVCKKTNAQSGITKL